MSESIITKKSISLSGPGVYTPVEDPYFSRIIKLIPADIISVYFAVFSLIKNNHQNTDHTNIFQLIIFGVFLFITPFYLKKAAKIITAKQIIYCVIAFILWVLSLERPIDGLMLGGYSTQFLGSVFLPVYTLLVPFIYNKTELK